MSRLFTFLLLFASALSASSLASAATVEHTFIVKNLTITRLCNRQVITAVNDSLPGPTINVNEGDTLIVHVSNQSPYNMTVHWHGVFQKLSPWADGPNMVTQCPIVPGKSYTYKFRVIKQEGTLWWHAHVSVLRTTVHGALIIRPRADTTYPFPKPYREVPILLGEWWNSSIVDMDNQAQALGIGPNVSDAFTINGWPGDAYSCSANQTYTLTVEQGKTYMLRIINAALNNQLFFKIANHNFKVVAIDASYTTPYNTDVIVIAPGQTVDALLVTKAAAGSYYMAASAYASAPGVPFPNGTTRGILHYINASPPSNPVMPTMPAFNDTPTAHKFYTNLTSLPGAPHFDPVPKRVDEHMFVTFGVSLSFCATCANNTRLSANMNNESFQIPTRLSMLQAHFFNVSGIYTPDFPDKPAIQFDYTNPNVNNNTSLLFSPKSTKVKVLKYNSTVQIVLQNTAILAVENHPIHIHGFDFNVLAQGFGNYDPVDDPKKFNLINPQTRNTIAVPVGGWAVIRFRVNNPGVWFVHCHLDAHLPWGLATAFVVENGPTPGTQLPPPPADLPQC